MQEQDAQWIRHPDAKGGDEMMRRVQEWLAEGRTLAWVPIYSRKNFPGIAPEILYCLDQCPERHVWLIEHVNDFLQIPDGITGWLLPEGDIDTDIVVGLWEGIVYFLNVVDRRTGEPQSLRAGKTREVGDTNSNGEHEATV